MHRWLGGTFGAKETSTELKAIADEAGARMADLDLPHPRARPPDTITTI
ncbi:hypothetical protein [Hyalangium versicolor]|nr:hypothetical protein [Hyalangium versicolor]